MLLRIASDIHAEFLTRKNRAEVLQTLLGSSSTYDYLVIAGDLTVTNHKSVLKEIYDITQKPIIFVPGNHDFWDASYHVKDLELRKQISDGKYGQHLHYLNNDSFIDGNHLIIGSTLWWQEQPENWTYLMRQMIDYHKITEMFTGRENGFDWGQEAMSFIIERLQFARDNALIPIVITHNAPSYRSVSDRFKHSPMNPFFANQ